MNIFLYELKANKKSTIIWTCVLIGISIMYLTMYPSFAKDMSQVNKMLAGYPNAVKQAMDISLNSFSTVIGFYGFIFTYIVLCGSIQAMNIGTSIFSKEIRDKTADFLLTKPVKRSTVMTAKLIAACSLLVITNIIFFIVVNFYSGVVMKEEYDLKKFILITVTLILVQLIFLSLGVLISVVSKKIRSVISITLPAVFGFFFIGIIGSVIGEKNIRYICPFKFYDATYIAKHSALEQNFIVLEIIIVVIAIAISYFVYTKKDIHAV